MLRTMPRITAHTCENGQFFGPVSSCLNLPPEGLLNWLIFSASTVSPSPTKVVWNLSRFAKSIFSQLPDGVFRDLQHSPYHAKWNNYRLFYISDKVLSVSKDGSEANFYNLSQFFPGEPEPDTLDKLQEKAAQLETALAELGIPDPPSLASPVACFNKHPLIKKLERGIHTIYDRDSDAALGAYDIALACTPREWVSNYQIGHFPELWKYDISSAYPYWATQLPDLSDCSITKADGVDILADYGFFVGDFTVFPDHSLAFCSPFLVDRGDGVLVNFVGTKKDYPCTMDELHTLYHRGMGSFQFKRGWVINAPDLIKQPFTEPFSELYALRGDYELKSYLLKRVMNGVIGRLLEVRRDNKGNVLEYGSLFNPIYHALITSKTRLQVFDFIASCGLNRDELVTVDVDGIRTTRHPPVPLSTGMGFWRGPYNDPAFVFSPGGIASTTRNFKRTDYVKLLEECKSRPRAVRLGADKKDPIDLSRLFLTQTRGFSEMPEQARDLLSQAYLSEPINLGA